MLKKRFYDILTIVFVILIILSFVVQFNYMSKNREKIFDCYTQGNYQGDALENCLRENGLQNPYIFQAIAYTLMGIYWLFILVLSIQLHKKDLTKTVDVVIIALISPLALIFYLTNLRKSLKRYESSNRS